MELIPILNSSDSPIFCKVDDEDYAWLSEWSWYLLQDRYAIRRIKARNKQTSIRMHRAILGLTFINSNEVDHIDGDGLNNQKSNLRVITHAQNAQNRIIRSKHFSSSYRGVVYDKARQKWMARARLNYKYYTIGRYNTELEAAIAVKKWRLKYMTHSQEEEIDG